MSSVALESVPRTAAPRGRSETHIRREFGQRFDDRALAGKAGLPDLQTLRAARRVERDQRAGAASSESGVGRRLSDDPDGSGY